MDIEQDPTSSGTWLQTEENGRAIVGAHFRPRAPGAPFTLMWLGEPAPNQIVDLCNAALSNMHAGGGGLSATNIIADTPEPFTRGRTNIIADTPEPFTRGRAFVSEGVIPFEGPRWLDAALVPGARFVRLDCSQSRSVVPQAVASAPLSEEFVLWARLEHIRDVNPDEQLSRGLDVDENIGVYLSLGQLLRLEQRLCELIAKSHLGQPGIGAVRNAVRMLATHISRPESTPAVAAAE